MYLAYTLGIDLKNTTGNDTIIFAVATVLFTLSGVFLILWSGWRLVKKDYYDPMTELAEDEEGEDSESANEK